MKEPSLFVDIEWQLFISRTILVRGKPGRFDAVGLTLGTRRGASLPWRGGLAEEFHCVSRFRKAETEMVQDKKMVDKWLIHSF